MPVSHEALAQTLADEAALLETVAAHLTAPTRQLAAFAAQVAQVAGTLDPPGSPAVAMATDTAGLATVLDAHAALLDRITAHWAPTSAPLTAFATRLAQTATHLREGVPSPPTGGVLQPSDLTYLGAMDLVGFGAYCHCPTWRYVDGEFRILFTGFGGESANLLYELSLAGKGPGDTLTVDDITNKWVMPVAGNVVGDNQAVFWNDQAGVLWWWGCYDYDDDGTVRLRVIDLTTDGDPGSGGAFGTTTLLHGPIALEGVHSKKVDRAVIQPPTWWRDLYRVIQPYLIGLGGYHSKVATGVSLGLTVVAIPDPADYVDGTAIPAAALLTIADHPFHEADFYSDSPAVPTAFDRGWRGSTGDSAVDNYIDGGDEFRPDNDQDHFGQPGNNGPIPDFPPTPHARWLSPAPDGHGRFTQGDVIKGGVWIDTPTRSGLVTLPSLQAKRVWYSCAHGTTEASAFEFHIYDPATLGAAAMGDRAPWQVQPDSITGLTLPGLGDGGQSPPIMDGLVYDAVARRLYPIAFGINGDDPYLDRIYIFGVNPDL